MDLRGRVGRKILPKSIQKRIRNNTKFSYDFHIENEGVPGRPGLVGRARGPYRVKPTSESDPSSESDPGSDPRHLGSQQAEPTYARRADARWRIIHVHEGCARRMIVRARSILKASQMNGYAPRLLTSAARVPAQTITILTNR